MKYASTTAMKDEKKTKKQLIEELEELRKQFEDISCAAKTPLPDSCANNTSRKGMNDSLEEIVGITENGKATTTGIISAISDGVSVQDKDFRVLYQNQAHKDLAGGDKQGSICYIAYAKNLRTCEGCPVEASFKDGEIHRQEKSLPDNRGYIEIKASPLFDNNGNIVAGIEVVRDITERKRIEKALYESEKRYRMLFENASDAILILDAEGQNRGRVIDANKAAAEIHGYTINELLTMKITDLVTPDTAREMPERISRIMKGDRIKTEVMHYTKSKNIIHVEINAGLLETGGHTYILAFERDITERKHIELERETLIRELQYALDNIKTLRGLIPICAWCKKIRDDKGYWDKIENYIQLHSHVSFTHGICPECLKMESPETFQKIKDNPELYNKLILNKDAE
jgi:PAS domain S-box-containing protein